METLARTSSGRMVVTKKGEEYHAPGGETKSEVGARGLSECSKVYAGFEEHTERMLAESVCNSSLGEIWKEYKGWWRSCEETIHTGPYGDLPILIFSRDPQK
jgi:hypothetical protein